MRIGSIAPSDKNMLRGKGDEMIKYRVEAMIDFVKRLLPTQTKEAILKASLSLNNDWLQGKIKTLH